MKGKNNMKRKTEYVETMIKKSVINYIITEAFLSVAILFTSFAPFFSDSVLLAGKKACVGYIILTITMVIFLICHGQFHDAAVYPVRICHDTYNQMMFNLEGEKDSGRINEEERKIYVKKIQTMFDWFDNFFKFFRLFFILELIIFFLIVVAIILKILQIHSFVYSSFYGITTFFIIFQYMWFFITARHLLRSFFAWHEKRFCHD